jgi:hypothetical protein
MGILDDAIREHLELKRRHGVPEEELQRQEEEALGPARRDVAQQHEEAEPTAGQTATAEADGSAQAAAADQETVMFDMEDAGADEQPVEEEPPPAEPTPVEPPPVEPPPVEPPPDESAAHREAPVHDRPAAESRPIEIHEPGEAVVGEPGHEPDPRDALGDTEPHGFEAVEDEEGIDGEGDLEDEADVEAAEPDDEELLESDAEQEDPDVLEDTPDFLQETPEHDRLWFEQKPPRDFDFD